MKLQIYYYFKSNIANVSKSLLKGELEKAIEKRVDGKNNKTSIFKDNNDMIQIFVIDSYYNKGINKETNSFYKIKKDNKII